MNPDPPELIFLSFCCLGSSKGKLKKSSNGKPLGDLGKGLCLAWDLTVFITLTLTTAEDVSSTNSAMLGKKLSFVLPELNKLNEINNTK